jgi:hypothetical protein
MKYALFLIVVALVGCDKLNPKKTPPTGTASPSASTTAFWEEKKPDTRPKPEEITAGKLLLEFSQNPIAAEKNRVGNYVQFEEPVEEIAKQKGVWVIHFRKGSKLTQVSPKVRHLSSTPPQVRCKIGDGKEDAFSTIKVGQTVVVSGRIVGKVADASCDQGFYLQLDDLQLETKKSD